MAGQLRVYRRRIASVTATKKITRAQELIATARIVKAQQRVAQSTPYAREVTRAVSAVASHSNAKHPLERVLTELARNRSRDLLRFVLCRLYDQGRGKLQGTHLTLAQGTLARKLGLSRQWVGILLARLQQAGNPRSRRRHGSPADCYAANSSLTCASNDERSDNSMSVAERWRRPASARRTWRGS